MKFYYFNLGDFDYIAVIWAANENEAINYYGKTVCDIDAEIKAKPIEIDIDVVFKMMVESGFDANNPDMAIGHIGVLHRIITSTNPVTVLLDSCL